MSLQEALLIAVEKFREKVVANINEMKQKTINFIKYALEQAANFDQSIRDHALEEQAKFEEEMEKDGNIAEDLSPEEEQRVYLLIEKEQLVQHLDGSKDFMESQIQKMETEINKAVKNEWDSLESNMLLKQHKRNRGIIKEIITTCKTFKSEIEEQFEKYREDEMD